jgi:hypothetical protein
MATFDVDQEEIPTFRLNGRYLFKQYFDNKDLFSQLEKYYNSEKYRFELPEDSLNEVNQTLDKYMYYLKPVEEISEYCVIKEKRADSSDILRNSVASQRHGDKDIFLMKDKLSARQAIEQGASHAKKSDLKIQEII